MLGILGGAGGAIAEVINDLYNNAVPDSELKKYYDTNLLPVDSLWYNPTLEENETIVIMVDEEADMRCFIQQVFREEQTSTKLAFVQKLKYYG